MVSESQERMLIITDDAGLQGLKRLCLKYGVQLSVIGCVSSDKRIRVKNHNGIHADLPANVIANAKLLDRPSKETNIP